MAIITSLGNMYKKSCLCIQHFGLNCLRLQFEWLTGMLVSTENTHHYRTKTQCCSEHACSSELELAKILTKFLGLQDPAISICWFPM